MDLTWIAESLGDDGAAAAGGLLVGLLFGTSAQRSAFCLRAATMEFWRGSLGPKTAIWLLVFGTALAGTQLLFETGILETTMIRQLSTTGTLSGAVIGGALFGSGMILARGCASRLLVLSSTGNLRALMAGLILTVVAQASLSGVLSPLRATLSSLWLVEPALRDLSGWLPAHGGLAVGFATVALAIAIAAWRRVPATRAIAAVFVGAAIVLGWWYTATLSGQAFDVVPVESVSFTGPSADTLMVLITRPDVTLSFGIGLVPGVFVGSFVAAGVTGEFRFRTFGADAPLPRYVAGACLMGFGGMLAGGCAVGAGVTGGSVMAMTAWIALLSMWISAGLTDLLVDRGAGAPRPAALPG